MDVSSKAAQIPCELCSITCPNQQFYDQHVGGLKHQKKVKRQELEALWEARDPTVYCTVCELALEPSLMENHVAGTKHKAMAEKRPEVEKERLIKLKGKKQLFKAKPVAKKTVKVKKSAAPVKEITCILCSVTINNLGVADTHFNSKAHAVKCAKKYIEDKKVSDKNPENNFYCDTCDMTITGQASYDLHLQGFKHNYKLMKGDFDPKSPFAEKTKKMKEKMEKMKEMQKEKKLQMRLSKEQESQE